MLLSAEIPSNASAPLSNRISTGSKRRKSAKSLSDSRESVKHSNLPITNLRSSQSENSLKKMTLKLQKTSSDGEFASSGQRTGGSTQTDYCKNEHLRRFSCSSSSDSKLSGLRYSEALWNKNSFSKFNCTAAIRKRRARKSQVCRYIWRCFFVASVCCLTDVATFGFTAYTQLSSRHLHSPNLPNSLTDNTLHFIKHTINETQHEFNQFEERVTISLLSVLAYNGNMIINLVCMILCYDKFVEMLLPCFILNPSPSDKPDDC